MAIEPLIAPQLRPKIILSIELVSLPKVNPPLDAVFPSPKVNAPYFVLFYAPIAKDPLVTVLFVPKA